MTEKAQKTVHIKWVRSGIGFTHRQKEMVRSLGLGRLHQVVELPDTAPIRGLVENIPHLVKVVSKPAKPEWMSVPEYTIHPPEVTAEAPARRAKAAPAPVAEAVMHEETARPAAKESKAEAEKAAAASAHAAKAKKPVKAATGKAKPAKAADSKKTKAADKAKPVKKTKK